MAHGQFPDEFYVKALETGVTERLCKFVPDIDMELSHIVLTFLKNGTAVGSESMTLKIFSSWNYDKPVLASSSARLLSATEAENSESWVGRLRFDFDRINLEAGVSYYLAISTSNYTRTPTFYLGAVLDWPDQIYEQGQSVAGAQIRLIGYKERDGAQMPGGEIRLVQVAEGTVVTAPSDMTVLAASASIPLRFFGFPGYSPVEEFDTSSGAFVMRFPDGGTEKAVGFIKVPQGYVDGTQITLLAALYSPSTSNTIRLVSNSYLIEKDTDALSSTADLYSSTNPTLTNTTPANRYREASLDITDSNGMINGTAVTAGDSIRVEIQRDSSSDTDTADIRFVPDLSEVQYND